MREFKSIRMGIAAAVCAFSVFAVYAAAITVDNVQQRWPWNNKVDITYTISGEDLDGKVGKVQISSVVNGDTFIVYDGPVGDAKVGTYSVTWENPPAKVKRDDCKMFATLQTIPVPEGNDYMVVDLATGAVTYEGVFKDTDVLGGVSGQELSNARYNVDKYKSTHYVLRKVPKGTYKTGDSTAYPTGGDRNNDATWTTDKDFYMGLFPWTNFQYWYVFDLGTDRPENQVNLKSRALAFVGDIRGQADPLTPPVTEAVQGQWWIIPWLRAKTGLAFDLPTVIMHEIATRAGTTTTYFWGNDVSQAPNYAVYGGTQLKVGSKRPNAWGLYDMVGNDWQWCLDCWGLDPAENVDAFTPAVGTDNGRRVRGQDYRLASNAAQHLNSARQSGATVIGSKVANYSFRVAYIVPNSGE